MNSLKKGIYEVFLTVIDNDGLTDTDQMTVAVLHDSSSYECNSYEEGYFDGVNDGLNESYNTIAGIIEEDLSGNKVIDGTLIIRGNLILRGE